LGYLNCEESGSEKVFPFNSLAILPFTPGKMEKPQNFPTTPPPPD